MFYLKKYEDKKIAIYGIGISGQSTEKILKKIGAKVVCWDDNAKIRRKFYSSNLKIEKFWLDEHLLDYIVISPGIDIKNCKIKNFLKNNSKKIITDLDIFFDLSKKNKVISITGTNGKSTTCKIVEKILKNTSYKPVTLGNIGKPILSFENVTKKTIFILEVSSFQLQYSKLFRSNHSAILNISPDHLDRHKSIKNYIKIKSKIFMSQSKSDYTYVNSQNQYAQNIKNIFRAKRIKSKLVLINKSNYRNLIKKINNKFFKSEGNITNLVFAYQIAKNLNINDKIIIKGLNEFKGLAHRQEAVFTSEHLLCVNDSKATSFDAAFQSLSSYNKIYWILGGIPKKKDIFYLKKVKKNITKAYIIGKNISFFKKKISKHISFTISKNMKNALNSIFKDLKSEDKSQKTILLSPASASFDQFNNFESRGDLFKKLIINKLKKGFNA
jgi:UDP-N-acetylmuramoylalanine--D-glutamate ligase